jgi:hypothetical protein
MSQKNAQSYSDTFRSWKAFEYFAGPVTVKVRQHWVYVRVWPPECGICSSDKCCHSWSSYVANICCMPILAYGTKTWLWTTVDVSGVTAAKMRVLRGDAEVIIWTVKVKNYPCNRPWRRIYLWDFEAPTFSRQSAQRWRCQPYPPVTLYPQEDFLYSFLLEALSTSGSHCCWKD